MSSYTRFDRQKVFSPEDRSLVLDMIGMLSKREYPTEVNMLYGLFDGYWYVGLESELMKTNMDDDKLSMLSGLLNKVASHQARVPQSINI